MLIEKAFAKLHGNWESIIAGDPRQSIGILSGAPVEHHYHRCPANRSCKTPSDAKPQTIQTRTIHAPNPEPTPVALGPDQGGQLVRM